MIRSLIISLITPGIFLLSSFVPDQKLSDSIKRGKEVYTLYCQRCHLEDGNGTPDINPPLTQAGYIKKPATTMIGVILKGQPGDVVVNSKMYNALMPAQDYLTDIQIANVVNYVPNSGRIKYPEL